MRLRKLRLLAGTVAGMPNGLFGTGGGMLLAVGVRELTRRR